MNYKKLLLLFILAGTISMSSCGNDDDEGGVDPACENFSDTISDMLQEAVEIVIAYDADPSTANCNAAITAANNFIDLMDDLLSAGCISESIYAGYEETIEQNRTLIETFDCSSLSE